MSNRMGAIIADGDAFFCAAVSYILSEKVGFCEIINTGKFDDAFAALGEHAEVALAVVSWDTLGAERLEHLRLMRTCFPEIIILVTAANVCRRDVFDALEAGVNGFVTKASGVQGVEAALDVVLGGNLFVPPIADTVAEPPSSLRYSAPARSGGVIQSLSPRQREVLELVVQGKSNKEIARSLKLGEGTVKVHMSALFRALQVNTRSAAAAMGAKLLVGDLQAA